MATLEDRVWRGIVKDHAIDGIDLPDSARSKIENTPFFQRRILNLAVEDFKGALFTHPGWARLKTIASGLRSKGWL